VAKRVEEELERRRDEIEAEVWHTLSLPLCLSTFTLLEHLPSCGFIKKVYIGQMRSQITHTGSRRAKMTHNKREKFIN
jgi:hypothetical protein